MAVVCLQRTQVSQEGVETPVEWVIVFCKHSQVPLPHLPPQAKNKTVQTLVIRHWGVVNANDGRPMVVVVVVVVVVVLVVVGSTTVVQAPARSEQRCRLPPSVGM